MCNGLDPKRLRRCRRPAAMLSHRCLCQAHCLLPRARLGAGLVPPTQLQHRGIAVARDRAVASLIGGKKQRQLHVSCAAKATADQLPASLKRIVGAFQLVPDPMARYKQLLFYATKLAPMAAADHVPDNKVEGCVSQVWVKPELRDDGKVYWTADSDSQLTKGLAALLVTGLSGCTPQEIIQVDAGFIELLGLKQSLTPSRNNGFLNMLRLMQRKALALMTASGHSTGAAVDTADAAAAGAAGAASAAAAPAATNSSQTNVPAASAPAPASEAVASAPSTTAASSRTPVQDGIRTKLTQALKPVRLTILDESAQHAGHAAMRAVAGKAGGSGETHFKVEVVSADFEGMTQVKRQRWVYQLLEEEFGRGLHALSLQTKTPSELN